MIKSPVGLSNNMNFILFEKLKEKLDDSDLKKKKLFSIQFFNTLEYLQFVQRVDGVHITGTLSQIFDLGFSFYKI